ncbi:MAG TPA: DUF805 domain-containing protein [Caulobacter sp.]|nr:DUF805 domain-containing protein [Caulobacter sp.]
MQGFGELFSFRGRTSRLTWWRVQLATSALIAALWVLTIFVAMGAGDIAAIPLLLILPVLAVTLATSVRRLHDRDRSAWWLLVFWAAPAACFAAASWLTEQAGDAGPPALAALIAGLAFELWSLVEIGLLSGSRGPNRFGPAPTRQPSRRLRPAT